MERRNAPRHGYEHPPATIPCLIFVLLSTLFLTATALALPPTEVLSTSFEGRTGASPTNWNTWGTGATWVWDASVARTGSRSLSISNSGWLVGWAGPTFKVDGSYASAYPCYVLAGWVRTDLSTGRTCLMIKWSGPDGWISDTATRYARASTNGKWVKLSVTALPPVGATSGQVMLRSDKNDGQVWFDDVSLYLLQHPITGRRPTKDDKGGPTIAPYRSLAVDYAQNSVSAEIPLTLAIQNVQHGKVADANTELAAFDERLCGQYLKADVALIKADIARALRVPGYQDMLAAVSATYPDSPQAAYADAYLAYIHLGKKAARPEVKSEFLSVAQTYPDSPCAMECMYRAGRLDLGWPVDYSSALDIFRYVKDNSGDRRLRAEAMVDIGLTYLQRFFNDGKDPQDFLEAFSTLQAVKKEFPDQVNAIARAELRIGRYYLYTEKDVEKARSVFENYLSAYPTNGMTEMRYQLAFCSFAEQSYGEAAAKCLPILADKNVDWGWKAWLEYFAGHCYMKAKDNVAAKAAFQNVIDKYPNSEFAKIARNSLAIMSGDPGTGEVQ